MDGMNLGRHTHNGMGIMHTWMTGEILQVMSGLPSTVLVITRSSMQRACHLLPIQNPPEHVGRIAPPPVNSYGGVDPDSKGNESPPWLWPDDIVAKWM